MDFILAHAVNRNVFKDILNNKFTGLANEYLKWKTAAHNEGDVSSWKNEAERLLSEWVAIYFTTEVKSLKLDVKKKQKAWDELKLNILQMAPVYYRRAFRELQRKGFPTLQQKQLPQDALAELLSEIQKEIDETVNQLRKDKRTRATFCPD